jgi:DNA-binding NarL/FixJ family response regulator
MVTQFESDAFVKESIAAGVSGYVPKSKVARDLIPELRRLQSEQQLLT